MKDKDIEKMLKTEIRDSTPNVLPAILSSLPQKEQKKKPFPLQRLLFSGACLLVCVAIAFGSFALWRTSNKPIGGLTFQSGGYVSIDINPSMQFTLDKDGKVKSVMPRNADARILLKNKNLVGKPVTDASNEVLTTALELGYMKTDKKNNALLLSASCENAKEESLLKNTLLKELETTMKNKGIYGVVITENKKSNHAEDAAKYNISESKYALIASALAIGVVIAETDYASISISELYEKIEERTEYLEDFDFDDAFEEAYEENEEQLERILENVEPLMEALENAAERLNEREQEIVENALEEMSDLLDEEKHLKAQELKKVMQKLSDISDSSIATEIQALEKGLSDMLNSIDALTQNMQEQMQRELDYHQNRYRQNSQKFASHQKEKNFDKTYKQWAKNFKKYCEDDWEKAKQEWEQDMDSGR